ncbi:VOC family protein [Zavarzinia sp. CC-PAN008]|uniref:VOC family protein n=1 Tax=Zavarzinia sp. CC-PAN008 TaxID=3243332 RepID=UPI003F746CA2
MPDAVVPELDHLVWAVPDLEQGCALFASLTGVAPATGGSHPGLGTRNALVSLGPDVYLELLAPDPQQDLAGTGGEWIAALPAPRLVAYCMRGDLDQVAARLKHAGIAAAEPRAMQRTRPDGVTLRWRVLTMGSFLWGSTLPFWIDWQGSPHPSRSTPTGCTLERFAVLSPEAELLARQHDALGLPIAAEGGAAPGFLACLATPRGPVWLTQ